MTQKEVRFKKEFAVLLGDGRCQFCEMVLKPGSVEGGPRNRHRGANQWLFVLSGKGVATINGKKHALQKWSLLLIARRETHEIRNTGTTPLRTLNVYSPPAYTPAGDPLPAGKP
jgi:mannose-6-phosphate isomerase-like protein (cupin superfamily)